MTPLSAARYTRPARSGALDGLDGIDGIEVNHPQFQAALTLQGAHLYHFAPVGEDNWLWVSPTARFEQGRAIRGGIPVCWPWFGDPAFNPQPVRAQLSGDALSAHGFARTLSWTLRDLQETEDEVLLTLVPDPGSDLCQHEGFRWSAQADVQLTFRFRPGELSLELTTTNTGQQPLALTQALHTYLPTADIRQTTLHGLDGTRYLDTLDQWQPKEQRGDVRFEGETDRVYQAAPGITIHAGGQRLYLAATGSRSTVVWNPGPEKARRLSDFPDDGWTGMLCVETANAADDYRLLAPGQAHTLAMTLTQPAGAD